jgi:ammonia channel protein AmtB
VRFRSVDESAVRAGRAGPERGIGIVGAIATGFIKWHTKTGGFPGATGKYVLPHAVITPRWQLLGVLLTVGLAAVPCLLPCLIFERASSLRATEDQEIAGLDHTCWSTPNFGEEVLVEVGADDSRHQARANLAR